MEGDGRMEGGPRGKSRGQGDGPQVVSDSSGTPRTVACQTPLSMGVGCHSLLQGIFPTQGLTPRPLHLLHWQADSLPLSHLGSPEQS